MNASIGHVFVYNIVITFIVIIFGFIAGTLSYYKAFKVSNRIVSLIERYEGYNDHSISEINTYLNSIGYRKGSAKCSSTNKGMNLSANMEKTVYNYCIYVDELSPSSGNYYTYGVVTYMIIELPIINMIRIPIFTKTNPIYKFSI